MQLQIAACLQGDVACRVACRALRHHIETLQIRCKIHEPAQDHRLLAAIAGFHICDRGQRDIPKEARQGQIPLARCHLRGLIRHIACGKEADLTALQCGCLIAEAEALVTQLP